MGTNTVSSRCPPRFLSVSRRPQPLTAWGGSLQGAEQGEGAQRCSDLPRPCKRLAATSGPPLPDPGFPALGEDGGSGGGVRSPDAEQDPGSRAPRRRLSQRHCQPCLPIQRSPPRARPRTLQIQFVFPSTHFLLFFSAHAHLNSNLSGN